MPGADTFNGSGGDDTFFAQDDEADAFISGGSEFDTAYIDTGIDPTPITVENVIGDGAPPPPPSATGCTYDAGAKTVTATLAPGESATLVVAGVQIRFGASPAACGAATTTNTDTIVVNGSAGSVETLTIDQSGGRFAPGATAETGVSEIEISVLLARRRRRPDRARHRGPGHDLDRDRTASRSTPTATATSRCPRCPRPSRSSVSAA